MRDRELDPLLKAVPLPERPPEYWTRFPQRVTEALRRPAAGVSCQAETQPSHAGWSLALGAACLVIGLALGWWSHHRSDAMGLAQARQLFYQITRVFPHQVRVIVLDDQGVRLELADRANIPASPPLLIAVRQAKTWRRFITFSGQNIRLNGESFEVLATAGGKILLVGPHSIWSDADPTRPANHYQIRAALLEASL